MSQWTCVAMKVDRAGQPVTVEHQLQEGLDRYRVRAPAGVKTFRGESAWSDAQRYANDQLPWTQQVVL